MLQSDFVSAIKNHKEELACIGAASICYNLIQYLRNRKNKTEEKPQEKKDQH